MDFISKELNDLITPYFVVFSTDNIDAKDLKDGPILGKFEVDCPHGVANMTIEHFNVIKDIVSSGYFDYICGNICLTMALDMGNWDYDSFIKHHKDRAIKNLNTSFKALMENKTLKITSEGLIVDNS